MATVPHLEALRWWRYKDTIKTDPPTPPGRAELPAPEEERNSQLTQRVPCTPSSTPGREQGRYLEGSKDGPQIWLVRGLQDTNSGDAHTVCETPTPAPRFRSSGQSNLSSGAVPDSFPRVAEVASQIQTRSLSSKGAAHSQERCRSPPISAAVMPESRLHIGGKLPVVTKHMTRGRRQSTHGDDYDLIADSSSAALPLIAQNSKDLRGLKAKDRTRSHKPRKKRISHAATATISKPQKAESLVRRSQRIKHMPKPAQPDDEAEFDSSPTASDTDEHFHLSPTSAKTNKDCGVSPQAQEASSDRLEDDLEISESFEDFEEKCTHVDKVVAAPRPDSRHEELRIVDVNCGSLGRLAGKHENSPDQSPTNNGNHSKLPNISLACRNGMLDQISPAKDATISLGADNGSPIRKHKTKANLSAFQSSSIEGMANNSISEILQAMQADLGHTRRSELKGGAQHNTTSRFPKESSNEIAVLEAEHSLGGKEDPLSLPQRALTWENYPIEKKRIPEVSNGIQTKASQTKASQTKASQTKASQTTGKLASDTATYSPVKSTNATRQGRDIKRSEVADWPTIDDSAAELATIGPAEPLDPDPGARDWDFVRANGPSSPTSMSMARSTVDAARKAEAKGSSPEVCDLESRPVARSYTDSRAGNTYCVSTAVTDRSHENHAHTLRGSPNTSHTPIEAAHNACVPHLLADAHMDTARGPGPQTADQTQKSQGRKPILSTGLLPTFLEGVAEKQAYHDDSESTPRVAHSLFAGDEAHLPAVMCRSEASPAKKRSFNARVDSDDDSMRRRKRSRRSSIKRVEFNDKPSYHEPILDASSHDDGIKGRAFPASTNDMPHQDFHTLVQMLRTVYNRHESRAAIEHTATSRASDHNRKHNERPSKRKLQGNELVLEERSAKRTNAQKKYSSEPYHSDSSSSSSDSDDDDDMSSGSTTLAERADWTAQLEPHQLAMFKMLSKVNEDITRSLVQKESVAKRALVQYGQDGEALIRKIHKALGDKVIRLERDAQDLAKRSLMAAEAAKTSSKACELASKADDAIISEAREAFEDVEKMIGSLIEALG